MDWLKQNWKWLAVLAAAIAIFLIGWNLFVKPVSEEVVKLRTELDIKKAELDIKKSELEASEKAYKAEKKLSDSLYSDWEKRQVKPVKDIQYENDIKFITSSSSFSERAKLFTDWLDSAK